VRGSKRSNLRKRTLKLKIQLFVLTEDHTKQLVFFAKDILKLNDSQIKTLEGWIITYIRVRVEDVSRWLAHEAKAGEVACLALGPLILLRARGVVTGEVEVTEGNTRSGHHLLELILLILEAVLLLVVTLTVAVSLGVLVLVEKESSFFLLGQSMIKWVVSPHSKQPLEDLLSLQNLCKARNFLVSRAISSSGMLS
jgi:hypothetical protein